MTLILYHTHQMMADIVWAVEAGQPKDRGRILISWDEASQLEAMTQVFSHTQVKLI
jgi:hypothetical protein